MYNLNGDYYKVDCNCKFLTNRDHKYIKISKKEYMKATGDTSYIINKLKNSVYPWQRNDYFFIGNIPIDWRLKPLIKFLLKNNIETKSSNDDGKYIEILFKKYKDPLNFLRDVFGKEKVVLVKDTNSWEVCNERRKQYKDKIIAWKHRYTSGLIIEFDEKILLWIYKKYNLKIPDHNKAHKGWRVTK